LKPAERETVRTVRALGICSGGLDSILSALVLKNQGIQVEWINFETPFFGAQKARRASQMTGIPLRVQNITAVYLAMLKDPHCGYGNNMNPCLDCHALMFRLAADVMKDEGYDFLFSGEVAGQRPMSQTKPSLRYVEKHSGADGYILRPLSAKLLPETIPEQEGLVDRDRLLDISGRGRKRQLALAEAFGIYDYPAPAGGCLLTDVGFSRRLKDLFACKKSYEERDFELLKHGRHFRLNGKHKAIVGRTKADNQKILSLVDPYKDVSLRMTDIPSPTVLIPHGAPEEIIREAAVLCAAYSKTENGRPVRVSIKSPKGSKIIEVNPRSRQAFQPQLI
jgi:tRNA U34 2-thiouridine synthase MnmA/TrmU